MAAPLVRPKRMFKTQAKALESVLKQSGLTASQVTPAHTAKAWMWRRKGSGSGGSKSGGNPGGKRKMAKGQGNGGGLVNVEAMTYGALGGGLAQLIARMAGPRVGPLAAPLGMLGASAVLPNTPKGRDVAAVLQTTAGAEFGAAAANWVPVPQLVGGTVRNANSNGRQRVVL